MTTICNTHRSYRALADGFLRQLVPSQDHIKYLNQCRSKVRSCLKPGLRSFIDQYCLNGPLPKFRIQGSWAYGLCNLPAHDNQELDLDYGVYLSASIFEGDLQYSGHVLKEYFDKVEALIGDLAEQEGWELDTTNDNCVRVILENNTHLDIPVYIVPSQMFDAFEENNQLDSGIRKSANASMKFEDRNMFDSINFGDQQLNETISLESYQLSYEEKFEDHIDLENINRITMAKRNGEYRESDCEQVRRWFSDTLDKYEDKGSQLRYICRYLKAWRDYKWVDGGGPSSILLMVIACQNYTYIENRDDCALLNVAMALPNALMHEVKETSIPDHENEDFNRIKPENRLYCFNMANAFLNSIRDGLHTDNIKLCILNHVGSYGERFPKKLEYIDVKNLDKEKSIFVQSAITTIQPKLPPSVTSG